MEQTDAHDGTALVAKLRARSSSTYVKAQCCKALRDLRLEGDTAADAIGAIVVALRHGADDATLQLFGCGTLVALMRHSTENRVTAGAAGAVDAIMASLRALPGCPGVQAQGCAVLMHISTVGAHICVPRVLLAPSNLF
jgi:hypothetical protein